ncbi:hypothetical protein BKA61DRAFT_718018 [Leptodontidium sp. MPI-SDFR-AT-0119]|nr:hypothetical protein BKA61DRAFT_718018 [Leptodontidium sp. MPI-SDFR-AT-0119]
MPAIALSPTATAPGHPNCMIIASNIKYHDYVSLRWPNCIIKQSYNQVGENYTAPVNTSSIVPSPSPTSSSSEPGGSNALLLLPLIIPGIVILFIIGYLALDFFKTIKNMWRQARASRAVSAGRRKQMIQDIKAWFVRKHTALFYRNQDRSLENAVHLSPIQRGLFHVRSIVKRSPTVAPAGNPRPSTPYPQPPAGPPPVYESDEDLPPPALPIAAHFVAGRESVVDDSPPPGYENRHQDPLYMIGTEDDLNWDSSEYDEDDPHSASPPTRQSHSEPSAPQYGFGPWRGATRDG